MKEANDTKKLIDECCTGCKYATNSMGQVLRYVKDDKLRSLIERYNQRHADFGDRCHVLLNEIGESETDPNAVVMSMAKMGTAFKLTMDSTTAHIAEILADGAAMAAKSISQKKNEYAAASASAKEMAGELVDMSVSMMVELLAFV